MSQCDTSPLSHVRLLCMTDSIALVLTNSQDATSDYLCEQLCCAKVTFLRFDTDSPLNSIHLNLSDGDLQLTLDQQIIRPDEIHTIIYRRPKPFAPTDSGDAYQKAHAADEWAEAVEGFLAHVPVKKWLNHPLQNFKASHKIEQLTSARECGLAVPSWIVTTIPKEAESFLNANGQDLIAKPLASGFIERDQPKEDTLIYTRSIDQSHMPLFNRLPGCPVLFQERVNKEADVRVIVVDNRMIAVSMIAKDGDGMQRLDIRRDNMQEVQYSQIPVPHKVAESISRLMYAYGIRFAAIDFAIDAHGKWIFFEVNPNGQWAWLDLVGVSDIAQLFIDTLKSSKGI